jgi:hypothetical protein
VITTEPILIMAFNRPDHLSRLIENLRTVAPVNIYVAIDGPRPGNERDSAAVQECRALVSSIDWTPHVVTYFRTENLGCGRGVTANIDWFFRQVDRGIILEDDILPDPSFFPFCSELLDRYENDSRVFAISGGNVVPTEALSNPELPYRFSRYPHVWGWATWKRSWKTYNRDVSGWWKKISPVKFSQGTYFSPSAAVTFGGLWEFCARGEIDTWDYQLVFAAMRSGQFIATSNVALVENIGFGENATHTHEGESGITPLGSVSFPLAEVPVVADAKADKWDLKYHLKASVLNMGDWARKYMVRQKQIARQRSTRDAG